MELEQVVSLFRMLQFERHLEQFGFQLYPYQEEMMHKLLDSIPGTVVVYKGRSVGSSWPYHQLSYDIEIMTKPLIDADLSHLEVRIMGGIKNEKPNKRWYHKFDKRRKY